MRIDTPRRIALDVADRTNGGFAAARIAGNATDRDPARVVLLRRHADMTDETPDAEARSDVEGRADRLAAILFDLDGRVASADVLSAVETAQELFKESGACYSVLLAVVTSFRVVAAGIGNVHVQLWAGDSPQSVLMPTTIALGRARVLAGALGLGYQHDRIQTVDLTVAPGDRVLIGVDADLETLHSLSEHQSASEVLDSVLEQLTFEHAAVIGVIGAAAEERRT